jgi:hypothetical protein
MATTPAPGPLEQSLAERAGAETNIVVADVEKYGTEAVDAVDAATARLKAGLDALQQHSASGQSGSIVQNAIEHLTAAWNLLMGHKAATATAPAAAAAPKV